MKKFAILLTCNSDFLYCKYKTKTWEPQVQGTFTYQSSVSVAKKIVSNLFLGLVTCKHTSKFKNEFGETVYVFAIDETIPVLFTKVWKHMKKTYTTWKDKCPHNAFLRLSYNDIFTHEKYSSFRGNIRNFSSGVVSQ
jgi:hypothetical protein